MKMNITIVQYNNNIPDKCTWYTWKETCDNCGVVIHEFNDLITTEYPNIEEKDYCLT